MPRKQETIEIDGVQYRIRQMGAVTGGQVMFRLGRAFAMLAAGLANGTMDLQSLSASDFDWLIKTLILTTEVGIIDVNGTGDRKWHKLEHDYDEHFAGRYQQMIQWLKGALEINFGPLQDALGSLFRGASALSTSPRQPVSTGSSGDSSSTPG
jgi:hypothetical protein